MSKTDNLKEIVTAAVLGWMHDLAPQGILLTDTSLTIVAWNQWLEERTGRRAKDVVGRNLLELYPDLVDRGLDSHYRDANRRPGSSAVSELHGYLLAMPTALDTREYSRMQQSARISPLLHDGEVIGTLTVIDDVTERVARRFNCKPNWKREMNCWRTRRQRARRPKPRIVLRTSSLPPSPMNCERRSLRLSGGRLCSRPGIWMRPRRACR